MCAAMKPFAPEMSIVFVIVIAVEGLSRLALMDGNHQSEKDRAFAMTLSTIYTPFHSHC